MVESKKCSFRLSLQAASFLDDIWLEVRKLRGDTQATMASIVDAAIIFAVADFVKYGDRSSIFKLIDNSSKTLKGK